MPTIYDNLTSESRLLSALSERMSEATKADFCVGYFNLRGWGYLADGVERLPGGEGAQCRLMIGMQRPPEDDVRELFAISGGDSETYQSEVVRRKREMADHFRRQLTVGAPTNQDEAALRRLRSQLLSKKLIVKLYLRHTLHAKLYLLHRTDTVAPVVGYVGSSNLTFAGLRNQGELNVDVVERDAAAKLQHWFDDRWADQWCLDISDELAEILDQSWATEKIIEPYLVYMKMIYHLSQDARAGLLEFKIPKVFNERLFEFQKAAVQIAAQHLHKRGGVMIGDVVGLGKTLMATALARVYQEDHEAETLIICPKNLTAMWESYRHEYGITGKVLSVTQVQQALPNTPRHRVVLIDESHNLRNPEGSRYRAIQEFILLNESKCILLSATPYNKTFTDLSAQLALFQPKDVKIGIRPERQIRETGELAFANQLQADTRTLAAFEKSQFADDWRDLMRLYLVRRTRGFIKENYAAVDDEGRFFLTMADGKRSYFPARRPKTVRFSISEDGTPDQYGMLFSSEVVEAINHLALPRYGLGNYTEPKAVKGATQAEKEQLERLSRAGNRLIGFSRTNLFKRLESSGSSFIQSLESHILRNFVYLHAIEHGKPIPLGTQDSLSLDAHYTDQDVDRLPIFSLSDDGPDDDEVEAKTLAWTTEQFQRAAAAIYSTYERTSSKRFRWIRPTLFRSTLGENLLADAKLLLSILESCGRWRADEDAKLAALIELVTSRHPEEKVLVFSQFADTVNYLADQMKARGITSVEAATGDVKDPTSLAWRFSPGSNGKRPYALQHGEIRVLIATDVLSEGQNLQDCSVVVNFDLPWAIIRLIQRVGRVDRIGQEAEEIICYSFVPAEGIEQIIRLRQRVRLRLRENAEVVGSDEAFFEDDDDITGFADIYNEKAGSLDGDGEGEPDPVSVAYQIWKNATDSDPKLAKQIEALPNVVYSTKAHAGSSLQPEGVLVYARTPDENDALAWITTEGKSFTESHGTILEAALCERKTLGLPHDERHHDLVLAGVKHLLAEETRIGGKLGRKSGARHRTYERLAAYVKATKGQMTLTGPNLQELARAIDEIYRLPLRQSTTDSLNRMLRSGASDEDIGKRVIELRELEQLTVGIDETPEREPRIICSMGLFAGG